jgi:NDP-sugar pyrophosphorylase family protein
MKAMILAAGLGTRLRPLTNDRPKALVEVGGQTLLEITLGRLRAFGIREVIINVHYLADMVVEYLKSHNNFGMRIEISREDVLLDTGGGLKKASQFFLDGSGDRDEPFVLHNVDVISTIDLEQMLQIHKQKDAAATLAVQNRKTSRYLLFDQKLRLCGRRGGDEPTPEIVRPCDEAEALAFSGIHIISPGLLEGLTEDGVFSIISSYLRLAGQGQKIQGFRADEYYWRDIGRPESVAQAEHDFKTRSIPDIQHSGLRSS